MPVAVAPRKEPPTRVLCVRAVLCGAPRGGAANCAALRSPQKACSRPGEVSVVGPQNPSRPSPVGCFVRLDGTCGPPRECGYLAGNMAGWGCQGGDGLLPCLPHATIASATSDTRHPHPLFAITDPPRLLWHAWCRGIRVPPESSRHGPPRGSGTGYCRSCRWLFRHTIRLRRPPALPRP
jgi:hypothetical protein